MKLRCKEVVMTTIYQYDDGKVIFVYHPDKTLRLINVVHDDEAIANKVLDTIIARLRTFGD